MGVGPCGGRVGGRMGEGGQGVRGGEREREREKIYKIKINEREGERERDGEQLLTRALWKQHALPVNKNSNRQNPRSNFPN